jgi:hypothetical protein
MKREHRGGLAAGLVLILLGMLFLIIQFLPGLQTQITLSWPLIIVGVGVTLLILAILGGIPGLAIPACIVGGIGVLLYWQDTTGNWDSWAYVWTLILGFAGLGVVMKGLLGAEDTRQSVSSGLWLILISLVLFAIFGSLFGALEVGGRYWPILLIVLGLLVFVRGIGHRGSIVGPVILIGLGIVLQLNNLGTLSWSIWEVVFLLWPILLVAAGLDILIGRRSALGSLLALTVTLALMIWMLWLFGVDEAFGGTASSAEINQSLDGASQAELVINPGVGRLRVEALPGTANLLEASLPLGMQKSLRRDFDVAGETATFVLQPQGAAFGPFIGGGGRGVWVIGINPEVPVGLVSNLDIGESELDLAGLKLRGVQASTGIGQATVVLPNEGNFEARIEGTFGQTTIVIPENLGARIRIDTGLAGRQLPPGYEREGDVYTSPGFEGADHRVELDVSQAVGYLTIRHPE